jgi:hypothetical protein
MVARFGRTSVDHFSDKPRAGRGYPAPEARHTQGSKGNGQKDPRPQRQGSVCEGLEEAGQHQEADQLEEAARAREERAQAAPEGPGRFNDAETETANRGKEARARAAHQTAEHPAP